uniref:Prolactin regulatory element-binding protein-like n=1 Tax=Ciona intestinalis TaxID=7719 RepID=A0A1W3JPZ4_CIOIN|nr:prolactin regulatory element-binding protein-like [Ciona intestinalis]|eukprot:XP_026690741.1 prolactin regulatory element-binding protein-like [Ciona intestinalis]
MVGLCKLHFPLYCCQCIEGTRFIVAGGGGAAKTGVKNCVQLLEVNKVKRKCEATTLEQLDTGIHAVMNMSAVPVGKGCKCHPSITDSDKYLVALGMGATCKIFSIKEEKCKESETNQTASGLKKRKKGKEEKKESPGEVCYKTSLLHHIDTATGDKGTQTAVRLSHNGSLLVAGASDGHLRAWKLPSKEQIFDSKGHKDDITDIDITNDASQIVSVSRDGKAFLWDASSGHKTMELHVIWNMKMISRNFRFRNCRFGLVPESPDKLRLFTTHVPIKRDPNNKVHCCITKWAKRRNSEGKETGNLEPAIVQNTGHEAISALAVSDDGVFVGLGFMDGSVGIYISFNLQCAKHVKNVHSIFVTSLSFVKESPLSRVTMGDYDTAIVSVSADCTCQLTKLESRALFSIWLVILLCFIAIATTAYYLNYSGLL